MISTPSTSHLALTSPSPNIEPSSISSNWNEHKYTLIASGSAAIIAMAASLEGGLFIHPTGWTITAALVAITAAMYFVFLLFGSPTDYESPHPDTKSSDASIASSTPAEAAAATPSAVVTLEQFNQQNPQTRPRISSDTTMEAMHQRNNTESGSRQNKPILNHRTTLAPPAPIDLSQLNAAQSSFNSSPPVGAQTAPAAPASVATVSAAPASVATVSAAPASVAAVSAAPTSVAAVGAAAVPSAPAGGEAINADPSTALIQGIRENASALRQIYTKKAGEQVSSIYQNQLVPLLKSTREESSKCWTWIRENPKAAVNKALVGAFPLALAYCAGARST